MKVIKTLIAFLLAYLLILMLVLDFDFVDIGAQQLKYASIAFILLIINVYGLYSLDNFLKKRNTKLSIVVLARLLAFAIVLMLIILTDKNIEFIIELEEITWSLLWISIYPMGYLIVSIFGLLNPR